MAKILLVEDDPLMVRMYQRKLVNDGYETLVAVDGEEGLVKIRSFRPDLVLLDIMMPKLNGLQVLERLKADPTTAKTPVIILTNLGGTQDDIERGLELGAVAYLVKSAYRPDEVIAKVKEILEGYTRSKEIPKVAGISLGGATRVLENTTETTLSSVKDESISGGHDDEKINKSQEDIIKKEQEQNDNDSKNKVESAHVDSIINEPEEKTAKKELEQKDIKKNLAPTSSDVDQKISPIPSSSLFEGEMEKNKSSQNENEEEEDQELEEPEEDAPVSSSVEESKEKPHQDTTAPKKKKETDDDSASPNEMIW